MIVSDMTECCRYIVILFAAAVLVCSGCGREPAETGAERLRTARVEPAALTPEPAVEAIAGTGAEEMPVETSVDDFEAAIVGAALRMDKIEQRLLREDGSVKQLSVEMERARKAYRDALTANADYAAARKDMAAARVRYQLWIDRRDDLKQGDQP